MARPEVGGADGTMAELGGDAVAGTITMARPGLGDVPSCDSAVRGGALTGGQAAEVAA